MIEDKERAKKVVLKVFKKLRVVPCGSVDKALADPTVRAYLGAVKDKKGRKFFLKVRVQDVGNLRRYFWKSYILGKILNKNPHLPFNKKTPKLLASSFGQNVDYLLYQYVKGENLGTRVYYDVIRLKMQEIDEILYILKVFLEIPARLFPKSYDRKGTSFFKEKFKSFLNLGIGKYLKKKEIQKLKKICQLSVLDQYLKFFSHGDFKPNNLIRTKKGIVVVDFEASSISNQFFDFLSIWGYAARKHRWRRSLMKRFLGQYQFKNREGWVLFEAEKVLFLMYEFGSLLGYLKKNLNKTGISVAKRYLPLRARELKEGLRDFNL